MKIISFLCSITFHRPWLETEAKKYPEWNIYRIVAQKDSRVHNHPNATAHGVDLFSTFYAARQCKCFIML